MSNNIKTELNIPDIWYDFYARLLPGTCFLFASRYLIQTEWIVPNATESFLLFAAGYFTGLFFQPLASIIVNFEFGYVQKEKGVDYVADVQAKVGAESRRSKILSKMQAATVFFAQLLISVCCLIALYFYLGLDRKLVLIVLFLALPYSAFGIRNVAKRRFIKAKRYESSHDKSYNPSR